MLGGFFPEMKDLVFRLHDIGSEIWAVSSTSEWVIQAGMKHFGIPAGRILAASTRTSGSSSAPASLKGY